MSDLVEIYELKDLLQVMYVPEQDLLSELPKEALMYVHFKTVGKSRMGDRVDSYTYVEFKKTLKENPKLANADTKKVLRELLSYIGFTTEEESIRAFKMDKVFDDSHCKAYPYYATIRELFEYSFNELCTNNNINFGFDETSDIEGLIISVEIMTNGDTPSFNLAFCVGLLHKILPDLINRGELPYKLFRFFANKMLICKSKIHSKHVATLYSKYCDIEEAKKEIERRGEEVQKLQGSLKELTKNKKVLEKQVMNNLQVKDYLETLHEKQTKFSKTEIDYITTELRNAKTNIIESTYETIIDKLTNQISDLKSAVRDKATENKRLKEQLSKYENRPFYLNLKDYLKEQGITQDVIEVLSDYQPHFCILCKHKERCNIESNKTTNIDQTKDDNQKVLIARLGYAVIEDCKHYVKFPDGSMEEINKLPEGTYLSKGQFVIVDNKYNFKFSFPYYCDETDIFPENILYPIHSINNNEVSVKVKDTIQQVKGVPKDIKLKVMQIIAIDKDFNFIRYFKKSSQNADNLISSLKAKSHKAYFILRIIDENKYFVRDIESNIEKEITINCDKYSIKPFSVISERDGEVISYFKTGKFYTLSNLYKYSYYAVIDKVENEFIVRKADEGEIVKVVDLPELKEEDIGRVIKIDEFNNFLEIIKQTNIKEVEKKTNKKLSKQQYMDEKSKTSSESKNKSILIIGNHSYGDSYLTLFKKNGYDLNIINGFEAWSKIAKYLKGIDLVLVVTEHVSHENMWEVKKLSMPIIFSKYEGANRLLSQVDTFFNFEEVAIDEEC